MWKMKFLVLIVCQSWSLDLYAQEYSGSGFNVILNLSNETLKDKAFSDLRFNGNTFGLGLEYEKLNSRSYSSLGVAADFGNIGYNNFFASDYINLVFRLKYAKQLENFAIKKFHAGFTFDSRLNILDYDGFENGSWTSGYSLGLLLRKEIVVKGTRLEIEFALPFIGLLSRPPYTGIDEYVFANTDKIAKILFTRNKLYTLNKFINPSLSLKYRKDIGKINLFTSIHYEFLFIDSVLAYTKHSFGLNLGLTLYFESES